MVDIKGEYPLSASPETVWEMFQDPDVLARIVPGCENLERNGENRFKGKMRISVGPVQGVFLGDVILSDIQPPNNYHLTVNGRGPAGMVNGEGDVALHGNEDGTTMIYSGQAQVSGRIASVGQRLMTSSANAIVKQSLQNLDRQIAARSEPGKVEEDGLDAPVQAPQAPDQTEFMWGVMKDVVNDALADERQRRMVTGLAAAVVFYLSLQWFAELVARKVVRRLERERR